MLAITVASAEPVMPSSGNGPTPTISSGFNPASSTAPSARNFNGVIASPVPRSAMLTSTDRNPVGIETKMTRR